MNALPGKVISIVAVCVAVTISAWAAMRVMDDRRDIARAEAQKATAHAEQAKANEEAQIKAAIAREHEAAAAKANEAAAKANLEAKKHAAVAEKAAAERAASEKALADEANRTALAKSRDAAAKAADEARAQEGKAKAERVELERVRIQTKAEETAMANKLRLAELEAEKSRQQAEQAAAEAKALELRRMNLEELELRLIAVKQDLDAREEALRPELTIKDLATTQPEDGEEGGDSPAALLREDDPSVARGSRRLARAERLHGEQMDTIAERNRSAIVTRLERLYVESIREDRVTDANYYRKELKRLCPGWEYKPPKKEEVKE